MASGRTTTIFRQLIFNIAIPTLMALLVFAGINFWRTRKNLASSTDERNILLSSEITKILRFQDISFNLIDDDFNNRFKEISSVLVNRYFANTDNIKEVDLRKIANEVGLDQVSEDIYVISTDGIVVNSTFKKDLNLNLFGLGGKMKIFLQDIFSNGKFVADLFAIEHTTHRPKKYTYQPSLDQKYIIELGAYSEKIENIIQAIEDVKTEIKDETPGIIDVELFLMADEPFSMNQEVREIVSQKDTLLRAFLDKDTISFMERAGKSWYHYQYIYMERSKTKDQPMSGLYKGSVIRIISDRTEQKLLFRHEALKFFLILLVTMLILTYLIYRKTRVITAPIKKLVENVNRITDGNLRERAEVVGNNEITRLTEKFNMMIAQLESYTYELEEKVKERTLKIEKQKEEIEEQKKHIMDSIYYARRIQNAILPSFTLIDQYLKNYFILYLPKDIVSGDFYWVHEVDGLFMVAAVDCTGHGVPGAFMSIVGFNQLNHAVTVKKARSAGGILDELNRGVIATLNENMNENSIKDGMDMSLAVLDIKSMKSEFAGANNPLILIRDNQIIRYKGDRFPIGAFDGNQPQSFKNNEFNLKPGDCLYLFSDGYADQFGGLDGKKFMYKRFEELLLEVHSLPANDQKETLYKRLLKWKGSIEQVDDILVIGIKI
jgi:serine phosphatase RsbU (regulator of sigma subunit)